MRERLTVRLLEFHLAHFCNMACRGCSHFSPSAPKAAVPRNQIEQDLERASRRLAPQFVHLLGGEPLLNRDLPALLPVARRAFPGAAIKLVTNGLLLGRRAGALLPVMAATDVVLAVSVYPTRTLDLAAISEASAAAGVTLELWHQDSFLDFITPEGGFDPALSRAACPMENALNVRDGRLYPCPVAAWSDFGGAPLDRSDGVPLTDSVAALRATLDRAVPTSKCRFCDPAPVRRPHSEGNRRPLLGESLHA